MTDLISAGTPCRRTEPLCRSIAQATRPADDINARRARLLAAIKIEARIALVDAVPLSDLDYRFFRITLGQIVPIARRGNVPDRVLAGGGFYAETRTWGGMLAALIATRRARRP